MDEQPSEKMTQTKTGHEVNVKPSSTCKKSTWMTFFDHQKYKHLLMLFKYRQHSEILEAIRKGHSLSDPYKPPIDLPGPEETFEPTEIDEDDAIKSQSSLSLDLTVSVTSSCPTPSTRSIDTSPTSKNGGHSKRRRVALVVLSLIVLLVTSVIVGIILHLDLDKGLLPGKFKEDVLTSSTIEFHTGETSSTVPFSVSLLSLTSPSPLYGTSPNKLLLQEILSKAVLQEILSQETLTQGLSSDGTTSLGKLLQGQLSQGLLYQGTLSQGSLSQGTLSEGMLSQGTLSQGTISQGTLSQGMSSQMTPSQGMLPQETKSQGTLPQGTLPQETLSQGALLQWTLPQGTLSQGRLSQGRLKQGGLLQGKLSQEVLPQEMLYEGMSSQSALSQDILQQRKLSQGNIPPKAPSQGMLDQMTVLQTAKSQERASQKTFSHGTTSQVISSKRTSSQGELSHETSSQEALAQRNPSDGASSQNISSQTTSSQGTSLQGTSSQRTPFQRTSSQRTSSQGTSSQDTPSQGTSSQDTPSQGTSSQDTPSQGATSQEESSQRTSSQGTSLQETSSRQISSQGTSSQGTPSHDTTLQGAIPQEASSQRTSPQGTLSQRTSSQGTSSQTTLAQRTSSEGASSQGISSQGTLSQGTLSQGALPHWTSSLTFYQGINDIKLHQSLLLKNVSSAFRNHLKSILDVTKPTLGNHHEFNVTKPTLGNHHEFNVTRHDLENHHKSTSDATRTTSENGGSSSPDVIKYTLENRRSLVTMVTRSPHEKRRNPKSEVTKSTPADAILFSSMSYTQSDNYNSGLDFLNTIHGVTSQLNSTSHNETEILGKHATKASQGALILSLKTNTTAIYGITMQHNLKSITERTRKTNQSHIVTSNIQEQTTFNASDTKTNNISSSMTSKSRGGVKTPTNNTSTSAQSDTTTSGRNRAIIVNTQNVTQNRNSFVTESNYKLTTNINETIIQKINDTATERYEEFNNLMHGTKSTPYHTNEFNTQNIKVNQINEANSTSIKSRASDKTQVSGSNATLPNIAGRMINILNGNSIIQNKSSVKSAAHNTSTAVPNRNVVNSKNISQSTSANFLTKPNKNKVAPDKANSRPAGRKSLAENVTMVTARNTITTIRTTTNLHPVLKSAVSGLTSETAQTVDMARKQSSTRLHPQRPSPAFVSSRTVNVLKAPLANGTTKHSPLPAAKISFTTSKTPITTTKLKLTTPYIPASTLDPFASSHEVGSPDGSGGVSLVGMDPGARKPDMQQVFFDNSWVLNNLPPPEVLPKAIATKIAVTPPPLTTLSPPRTPKPPETTTEFMWTNYLQPVRNPDTEKLKIIAPDVVAEIGMSPTSNLKVVCIAQKAWGWTYIAISRYEGDSEFSLEFLGGVDKTDEWPFIPIDSRMSDFTLHRDDDQVTFALETKYALCEDKGRYLCEVKVNRTFFSKTFNVDVKKRPEAPVLKFPEDMFTNEKVWLVTTWDAGNPVIGYIVHDIVKGFTGLPFAAMAETTQAWYKDCAVMMENRYYVVPELSWNGTEIIAHILPGENTTNYEKSIVERVKSDHKTMIVLDNKICDGHNSIRMAHPYNNNKYITCYSNGPSVTFCPDQHIFDDILKTCVSTRHLAMKSLKTLK